jgi:putative transposase
MLRLWGLIARFSQFIFVRMNPEPLEDKEHRYHGKGANRAFYLPRLPREHYQGDAVVHWTMPVAMRKTGWISETFHAHFREMMLHAAAREGLFCPTYCLMPDHIHLVWMGLRRDSDQRNGMRFLREHVGKAFRAHRFQHQPHDHVLRAHERKRAAFARVCFYIVDNARKAGLVEHPRDWPFAGAMVVGYPKLHPLDEGFWPLFWKLYYSVRATDAGDIKRPPLGFDLPKDPWQQTSVCSNIRRFGTRPASPERPS